MESHRYTAVAITLHWLIALAIGGLIMVGWYMGDLENGDPNKQALYQMHKSVGITVLMLTLARIAWRVMNPPPPLPAGMEGWEASLSHGVHVAFYALMVLMPLTGWLYVSTSEFQVPTVLYGLISWPHLPFSFLENKAANEAIEFTHSKLAWLAIGLIGLHAAGAVKHELSDEEGVLKRMIPGLVGDTNGPVRPARGLALAFGGALAVFLAIASVPLLGQARAELPGSDTGAIAANWTVDPAASSIGFSGTHDGKAFAGTFSAWTAAIDFDPAAPADGAVAVTVDTGSAVTGTKLYDDSLRAAEWFNISAMPTATVTLANFRASPDADPAAPPGVTAWLADATLTVKDRTLTVPFTFTLVENGETATMTGKTQVTRSALDLGQKSDAGADWVSNEIDIAVTVTATRKGP